MNPALRSLQAIDAYRERFELTTHRWWLPMSHAAKLAGWSRQRTHQLKADGLIATDEYVLPEGSRLMLVSGNDLVSLLRSRL